MSGNASDGVAVWRLWLDELGYTGGAISADTQDLLVDESAWDGDMASSLLTYFDVFQPSENLAPNIVVTALDFTQNSGDQTGDTAGTYVATDPDVGDVLTVTFNTASSHYTLDTGNDQVLLTSAAIAVIDAAGTLDAIDLKVTDDGDPNLSDTDSDTPVVTPEAATEVMYLPDAVDDYILGGVQAVDISNDSTFSFEFNLVDGLVGGGTLMSQNISSSSSEKALQIYTSSVTSPTDDMIVYFGGEVNRLNDMMLDGDHRYKITIDKSGDIVGYRDDSLMDSFTLNNSFNYEPTAKFKVHARSDNGVDTIGFLSEMALYDLEVYSGGVKVIDCRINDGWSADPVIANSGTTADLVAQNFQSGGWIDGGGQPIENQTPTIDITALDFTQNGGDQVGDVAGTYVTDDQGDGDVLTVTVETPSTHYTLNTGGDNVLLTQAGVDVINAFGTLDAIHLRVTDDDAIPLHSTDTDTPVVFEEGGAPAFDPVTGLPVLPWFHGSSLWNQEIEVSPDIDPDSQDMIDLLVSTSSAGGSFVNFNSWTMPVYMADAQTPTYDVVLTGGDSSVWYSMNDVPIPIGALADTASDGHLIIIDTDTGFEWDMIGAKYTSGSDSWTASNIVGRAGIYGNTAAEDGFFKGGNSSRACGFACAGGLILPEELNSGGEIGHALVFAYPRNRIWNDPRGAYFSPATASDYNWSTANGIPQGALLQMNPALDVDDYPSFTIYERKIFVALQKYGMYNGDFSGDLSIYALNKNCVASGDPYDGNIFGGNWGPLDNMPWDEMRVLKLPAYVATSWYTENSHLYTPA